MLLTLGNRLPVINRLTVEHIRQRHSAAAECVALSGPRSQWNHVPDEAESVGHKDTPSPSSSARKKIGIAYVDMLKNKKTVVVGNVFRPEEQCPVRLVGVFHI